MNRKAIVVVVLLAFLGYRHRDKIQDAVKNIEIPAVKDSKDGVLHRAYADHMKSMNWSGMAAIARKKGFTSKEEAGLLGDQEWEKAAEKFQPIKDQITAAAAKEDWQTEIANLYDKFAREAAE